MRKRIKFKKYGPIKFIGHLDLLRIVQRFMRKAKIPMAYSQGYNPHPLISFAQPLGLGFTSDGEYLDMTLKEEMTPEELQKAFNEAAPDGIEAIKVVDLEDRAPKAMALVAAANYKMKLDQPFTDEDLKAFMDQEEIIILKKNKKKRMVEVDLKPSIMQFNLTGDQAVTLFCKAGTTNVKPQFLLRALYEFKGVDFDPNNQSYHRVDLFMETEETGYAPLLWS